jgi:hypothetical protein
MTSEVRTGGNRSLFDQEKPIDEERASWNIAHATISDEMRAG